MSARLDVVVREAAARLAAAGVPSPRSDAVALVAHVLGADRGEVERLALLGRELPDDAGERLEPLLTERCARVPLQHLVGRAPFRHLELAVGPGVFVPRPETELAVDLVLAGLARLDLIDRPAGEPAHVVDLCTGSGAIALAVLTEGAEGASLRGEEAPVVRAVELSPEAHAWAQQNVRAVTSGSGLTLDLRCEDARAALPGLEGTLDIVVSNPPYIPDGMVPLEPEVHEHDPALALYGQSADGLAVPLAVADRAAQLLRPGGLLVMEHADAQGESLPAALRGRGWVEVVDHPDHTGRPRCVTARRPGERLPGHRTKEDS